MAAKPKPEPAEEQYTVRLADGVNAGQFHVEQAEVELDVATPTFTTSNRRLYLELLDIPFLAAAT